MKKDITFYLIGTVMMFLMFVFCVAIMFTVVDMNNNLSNIDWFLVYAYPSLLFVGFLYLGIEWFFSYRKYKKGK
jgi:hypothetical protein